MAPVPFHYLDLQAFAYATEDTERVVQALQHFLPEDATIEREASSGHHGDAITILSTRIETADEMRVVLDALFAIDGVERFQQELSKRIDDDCAFFLRFDKQQAFQGHSAIGKGIQLRGKVEAYPASKEAAIDNVAAYFQTVLEE